jgi:glycerol-3-phosphate dehydrogenase (NAD(P)+)
MDQRLRLAVIGAGAWGTAVAIQASARHHVHLLVRDAQQHADIVRTHTNNKYLPGVSLPPDLSVVHGGVAQLPPDLDLIVLGTPMSALRSGLAALQAQRPHTPVAWLCKGFEMAQGTAADGLMPHEVQAQAAPQLACGVLSGPSFAQEVALGQPTALVAASAQPQVSELMVKAFHGDALRVYANADLVGVEVGGAVKNVLAIATGLCDGMQLGLNARAALITRGLAEMMRLGMALGARAETFMGLSGLGDLVLTATGDLSRNRRVGLAMAGGKSLAEVLAELGHVAEGVYSAKTVFQRAKHLGVEMPITEAVVQLLDGQLSPRQGVAQLMGRDAKSE